MTTESMMDIIERHNLVVEALRKCDIKVKASQAFTAMSVWHKLACEGSSIVSEARKMGIGCKIDMQSGEIVFEEKGDVMTFCELHKSSGCNECPNRWVCSNSTLKKFFYTFGTDPGFPYCRGWVEVYADSLEEAHEKFRTKFPDRPGHEGIINCAFFYDQEEWRRTAMANSIGPGEFCHEIII